MSGHNTRRVLLVAVVTIAVDWLTKFYAVSNWGETPLDLGWVRFVDHRNPGIAFSLGDSLPTWAVIAGTGVIVVALSAMALRGHFQPDVGAGLIVGGGLGNLGDRVVNGAVVDMIDLGWWPTFNVADVALNVGVGLIVLYAVLHGDGSDPEDRDVHGADHVPSGDGRLS